jgi:uncharacterized Zn-finger protein
MNCFYLTSYSLFSANGNRIFKTEYHILEIRERFKKHSRQFILRSCEHVTLHLKYFPNSGWPNLHDWLMQRCYEVSRTQNSDCNSETRGSILRHDYSSFNILWPLLEHIAILIPSLLTVFVKVAGVILPNNSHSISTKGSDDVFFSFQSVKLKATNAEAAHCSKDTNVKQLPGKDSAEFYSCQICKNSFPRKNILSGHASATSRETTSYCEMCVKSLSDNRNAVQQLRRRERLFSCNVCNKGFTSRSNLDNHIRVHTGERSYSCEMCYKSFTQRSNLKAHLQLHNGDRPFSCEICKKLFTQRSNLNTHLRVHSGERPFSCLICKKIFAHSSVLKRHTKVHSGERPFSCQICKKRFTQRFHLIRHFSVHSGKRPFSCEVCKKRFTERFNLKTHLRMHSGERPFSCKICNKMFSQSCAVKRHMKVHS